MEVQVDAPGAVFEQLVETFGPTYSARLTPSAMLVEQLTT